MKLMEAGLDTKSSEIKSSVFNKRVTKEDGSSKSIDIEKCENGYIISICTEGKKENGDWEYTHKKYISKTNPLKKENDVMSLSEFLKEK